MSVVTEDMKAIDPGLFALGLLLRLNGVTAKIDQIRQRCGNAPLGIIEILRGAKKFGLNAVIRRTNWEALGAQLPAIALMRDGSLLILGKLTEEGVVVVRPPIQKAELDDTNRVRGGLGWPACGGGIADVVVGSRRPRIGYR